MRNSVTVRNLTGGFLGGVIGILTSWYWAPLMMPFGVLLGVIIGWWAKDIALAFIGSYRTAFNFWQWIMTLTSKRVSFPWRDPTKQVLTLAQLIRKKIGEVIISVYCCIRLSFCWIATLIQTVLSVPRRLICWRIHPSNKAFLISIVAIIIGIALTAVALTVLIPWPETHMIGGGSIGKPLAPLVEVPFGFKEIAEAVGIMTLFLSVMGIMHLVSESGESNAMQNFYTRWERYSQYSSSFTYLIREVFCFFKAEVSILVFFVVAIAYWITLGGALVAFVTIPVVAFVTFMVNLCRIAQRSAHWWCLGVTLVVTTTSAIIFRNSFGDEILLWTIALGTGVVSGVATEGLRRLGVWWETTEIGQHYLDIWYDDAVELPFLIARPTWQKLSKKFQKITECLVPS